LADHPRLREWDDMARDNHARITVRAAILKYFFFDKRNPMARLRGVVGSQEAVDPTA
jgi:hypothetical protein